MKAACGSREVESYHVAYKTESGPLGARGGFFILVIILVDFTVKYFHGKLV